MTIQVELWQLLTMMVSIIGGFWAMARLILTQSSKQINDKFTEISTHMRGQDESARRLERELMELKAELPRDYVRREDYTQAVAIIMTKIDALGLRMENIFQQVMLKGGRSE